MNVEKSMCSSSLAVLVNAKLGTHIYHPGRFSVLLNHATGYHSLQSMRSLLLQIVLFRSPLVKTANSAPPQGALRIDSDQIYTANI
eukprot:COSAG02_NODE_6723_length_3401_cov_1.704119_1_plen_86_part_00